MLRRLDVFETRCGSTEPRHPLTHLSIYGYFPVQTAWHGPNRYPGHAMSAPCLPQAEISIRRGLAFACFGIATFNTPFLPVALTLSLSTVSGNMKRR
jgi:hypothetical protein